MYTENGITYVVGMEDEFMGYFLKFHRHKYKHVELKEEATPEQIAQVKEAELQWRLKQAKKRAAENALDPQNELFLQEATPAVNTDNNTEANNNSLDEWEKQKQREYHRQWYQQNRERETAKNMQRYWSERDGKREREHNVQNIPYVAGTAEYMREYYKRNKERIAKKAQERYQAYKDGQREKRVKEVNTWGRPSDYDDINDYQRAYRAAHRERTREYTRNWYANHPEYYVTQSRKNASCQSHRESYQRLKADPERYAKHLARRREYERIRLQDPAYRARIKEKNHRYYLQHNESK